MATRERSILGAAGVNFLVSIAMLVAGVVLVAVGLAIHAATDARFAPFTFDAQAPTDDANDAPRQQLRSGSRISTIGFRRETQLTDRAGSTALPRSAPLMRPVESYAGSDPARPDRNSAIASDDQRTVILRTSALAHRRPFVALPRYVHALQEAKLLEKALSAGNPNADSAQIDMHVVVTQHAPARRGGNHALPRGPR